MYSQFFQIYETESHNRLTREVLFQMRVEPVDEVAVPEEAVLRLQHPVGLVREVEVARVEANHLGRIVGRHALRGHNTEVELTVDHTDGSIPFVNVEMR